MKAWAAYGLQRSWPNKQGSVWVEDTGAQADPWAVFCSNCDEGESYATAAEAMKAADKHAKGTHS